MLSEIDRVGVFAAKYFKVREDELYGKKKNADIVIARWITWYVLHTKYNVSANKLAKEFYRTRRGVFKGLEKIRYWLEHQRCFQNLYEKFLEELEG